MMATSDADAIGVLQHLPLFRDLTPRQLETLAKLVTFSSKAENELVMRTAASGDVIHCIVTGFVKICTPRDGQSDLILGLRGPGEVLGEMSVVDAQAKSANVITHTACELASLPKKNFWGVVWEFPAVPFNLAHLLNERIRRLSGTTHMLSPCQSEPRLARQLLLLAGEFGQETPPDDRVMLPFPLSATDLAGLTAMPLPEISELLRDWQREGIVGPTAGTDTPFVLRDYAALQAMAA